MILLERSDVRVFLVVKGNGMLPIYQCLESGSACHDDLDAPEAIHVIA